MFDFADGVDGGRKAHMGAVREPATRGVLVLALVGAIVMGVGTLASYFVAVGATPEWLYDRFGTLGSFTTKQLSLHVPVEFVGLVAFACVALLAWWSRRFGGIAWVPCTFLASIAILGAGSQVALENQFRAMPLMIGLAVAAALLCVASLHELHLRQFLTSELPRAARALVVAPPARAAFLSACVASVLGAQVLHSRIERVSPDEARERAFLTWYDTRTPPADAALRRTDGIRVVVFTDYECPFCATQVPDIQESVRQLQESVGYQVDVIVRDFPLEAECNPAVPAGRHMSSCEAAAAVRLVHTARGRAAAKELAMWFYQRGSMLSSELISSRLAQLQLLDDFTRQYPELVRQVAEDVSYGSSLGVRGTPTIFINGVRLPGGAAMFRTALKREAARR